MGTLENSSLSYGKIPLALIALAKAKAGGLALHLVDSLLVSIAAVRTNWTVWPKQRFDVGESGLLVFKLFAFKN